MACFGICNALRINRKKTTGGVCGGFTLLELLLAITILAFIIGTLYATFWGSTNNTERIRKTIKVYQTGRLILIQLVSDLESAYYDKYAKNGEGDEKRVAFRGEEITGDRENERLDKLSFLTTSSNILDAEKQESMVWFVSYFLQQNSESGDYSLIRRAVPYLVNSDLVDKNNKKELTAYDLILSRHVKSFQIEYINLDGDKSDDWDPTAVSGQAIPAEVRISMVLNNPEGEAVTLGTSVFIPVAVLRNNK